MTIDAIRLSPDDNVVVTCRAVNQGTTILVDGVALTAAETVPIGHKLAFTALDAGAGVIKYGMPIGSMTHAAQPGDWVHMHNMKSDYMPAHLRDATGDMAGEAA
jgi:SAF domain